MQRRVAADAPAHQAGFNLSELGDNGKALAAGKLRVRCPPRFEAGARNDPASA
jgi:hypothetical protein